MFSFASTKIGMPFSFIQRSILLSLSLMSAIWNGWTFIVSEFCIKVMVKDVSSFSPNSFPFVALTPPAQTVLMTVSVFVFGQSQPAPFYLKGAGCLTKNNLHN